MIRCLCGEFLRERRFPGNTPRMQGHGGSGFIDQRPPKRIEFTITTFEPRKTHRRDCAASLLLMQTDNPGFDGTQYGQRFFLPGEECLPLQQLGVRA